MTATRQTAAIVGLLFLTATATFIAAEQVILPVFNRPDFLLAAPDQASLLTVGALLAFIQGIAVVGLAIFMFPLLKRTSEPLALGYLGLQITMLGVTLLYVVAPLMAIGLGNGLRDGTIDASASQSLGSLVRSLHDVSIVLLYLVTSVSGTIFTFLLYRSRLVPRPIATLGLIGYPILVAGAVLDMFGVLDVTQGVGLVTIVPGGLFELILPIWLLVKGFSHPTTTQAPTGDIGLVQKPA
jgi:hypothetical protein